MRRFFSLKAGFTLVELALVLTITGIVLGGLWVLGANVFYNQSINQLEKGIVTTASRIRNFYRDRQMKNDQTTLTNTNLIQLDLIAPELSPNPTANTISFSPGFGGPGTVNITYDHATCNPTNSSSLNNNFAMTLTGITKDACSQLLPRLVGTSGTIHSNGIAALFVAGTNVVINNANNVLVFDGPTAIAKCADGVAIEICFAQ